MPLNIYGFINILICSFVDMSNDQCLCSSHGKYSRHFREDLMQVTEVVEGLDGGWGWGGGLQNTKIVQFK